MGNTIKSNHFSSVQSSFNGATGTHRSCTGQFWPELLMWDGCALTPQLRETPQFKMAVDVCVQGHCPGCCHLSLSCKTAAAAALTLENLTPSPTEKPLKQPHPQPWRRAVYLKYMPTTLHSLMEERILCSWTELGRLLLLRATSGRRTLAGGQVRRSGNNNSNLYLLLGTSQYFYIFKKNWLLRYFTLFKSLQRP